MKDDNGQMVLLSAIAACICLISIVILCTTVSDPGDTAMESSYLSRDSIDNILWAQNEGIKDAIRVTNILYSEHSKYYVVDRFRSRTGLCTNELAYNLLKHGVSYQLTYNDTLSEEYVRSHNDMGLDSVSGVIVKEEMSRTNVYGCAYDIWIDDGVIHYRTSVIEVMP